ncbi:hypothetical protein M758_10G122700 [Ceratodon purpureus]|nr:hypothetical protein M758_10G122700 [Ceratodon purpureus]
MMGIRSRNRSRQGALCPAISTISVVCFGALLLLAVLSVLSGRLLDIDADSRNRSEPSRGSAQIFQFEDEDSPIIEEENVTQPLVQKSLVVPDQWDTSAPHVWDSENAEYYYGCSEPSEDYQSGPSSAINGYLLIAASGGLNQQRTGITDSIVVARLLNATLVVPQLDHRSYWKDSSNFSDIFDVDWFIKSVAPDVKVVKELPEGERKYLLKQLTSLRVPRKVTPHYYLTRILPTLRKKHFIRLTKFDYRLANRIDTDYQKLRCRTNYKALRFTPSIQNMGQMLVDRMRAKGGRYIALHLRYESDMLAFSGCYYGGGEKEKKELGAIRKRWKTLHYHDPERERRNGKCPLTPEEVGLMLRALGYGNDSYLYVASGEVYNGEASLAPLKALFPNYFTKETISSKMELKPFKKFSSQMAAIDYIVCSQSDVFVANNNGNMARILAGERRFNGHKRTIRPNAKKLGRLLPARHNMTWEEFAETVQHVQKGFMGDPMEARPGRGEFHENPAACICEKPEAQEKLRHWREQQAKKPKKVQEATEIKAQDPVIPVEDRIEAEEEDDEEVPLVIEDEQAGEEIEGGAVEDLLLENESTNEQESAEGAADDEEEGDNY